METGTKLYDENDNEMNQIVNYLGEANIPLPNYKPTALPTVKLKKLRISNFKVFEAVALKLMNEDETARKFTCLIGNNGCGKSTILNIIQLVFSNFGGHTGERLEHNLSRGIRRITNEDCVYSSDNFQIEADIESSIGDYTVALDKYGWIVDDDGKYYGHPEEIANEVYRLCYYARFDQELTTFQLRNDQWPIFKCLFESVTGFVLEEVTTEFSSGSKTMDGYIFDFLVHKPYETISHKDCSAGEKKMIKTFSTLLNLEVKPEVILIDNIELHVEIARHLPFVNSLRHSFPDSQIVTTTHSYHISRNFSTRSEVSDLRKIRSEPLLREQPWRQYMIDELSDCVVRLQNIAHENKKIMEQQAISLMVRCNKQTYALDKLRADLSEFMAIVAKAFVEDVFYVS